MMETRIVVAIGWMLIGIIVFGAIKMAFRPRHLTPPLYAAVDLSGPTAGYELLGVEPTHDNNGGGVVLTIWQRADGTRCVEGRDFPCP